MQSRGSFGPTVEKLFEGRLGTEEPGRQQPMGSKETDKTERLSIAYIKAGQ